MPGDQIGKITHYFPKVGVAVLELTAPLKVGDMIEVVTHDGNFTQKVDSMQVDHAPIQEAKPGQSIGLKVSQKVHEGNKVHKPEPAVP